MKKTFLAKRNALLTTTNLSWGTLALALAILLLCVRLVAPNFFWKMLTPVFSVADALSAQSHIFFSSFANTAALSAENERLAEENATLTNENQALSQKEAALSALLGAPTHTPSGILAGVIARPPTSPYDTLVLSSGSSAGVTLGMEAFGPSAQAGTGGVPLGIVSSVSLTFSRVTLFSSPEMVVDGWVASAMPAHAGQAGHTNIPLTIFGVGASAMQASIARAAGVAVNDAVFVPGPGALPIGRVARIDGDLSSPGVTLRIQPAFNPFSITWVLLRDTGALRNALHTVTSSAL